MELSLNLENAIKAGDVQRVRNLLQENDVNLRAPENINLLWSAIFRNKIEIIEILIRAGADLAAEDPHEDMGYSILHDLVRKAEYSEEYDNHEYERLALLAIDHGADVNAFDGLHDESVLEFAVSAESVILTKELIRRGAQVNEENLDSIIMEVAHFENPVEVLPLLINSHLISPQNRSRKAVDAMGDYFSSPSFNFNITMFEEMLQMIEDVNQPGSNGETMLVAAARCGRLAAVTVLLNRGADINKKSTQGVLPIYAASSSWRDSKVTKLFISLGASINDRNDDGKYPIHGACESRSTENLHYLMSIGASLNVTDYSGQYPIHSACSDMATEVLHSLLSIGTPINVTDIRGNTPFSLNRNLSIRSPAALFVKQFALLDATTGAVSESDLSIVEDNPDLLSFFERCRNELQTARQTVVFENFNLLMLLATSTTKLSAYMRNTALVEAIENYLRRQYTQFPIYLSQFRMALLIAPRIRDNVKYTETVLEQSFPVPVPQLVIEKIALYMLAQDVISTELKFYSILYKQITEAGLDFFSHVINPN